MWTTLFHNYVNLYSHTQYWPGTYIDSVLLAAQIASL